MFVESAAFIDLVARIESLEPLEELSLRVHSPSDEDRLLGILITSYSDESADKRFYSVCSLLGKLKDFVELERRWNAALRAHGIPEFHASHLEQRLKPYEALDRDRRDFLQRTFIGLITDLPIWGFCSFVGLCPVRATCPDNRTAAQ